MPDHIRSVAVFCGSRPGTDPAHAEAARALGAGLAAAGITLVYGGGGIGLMAIAAQAALTAGGRVRGVIPDFLMRAEKALPGLEELEVTPSMHARKTRMFEISDAFIALSGGLGTLDETVEILTWRQLGLHDKPVVICDPDDVFEPLRRQMDLLVGRGFARPEIGDSVAWASTAAEAVDLAEGSGTATRPDAADILEAEL